MKKACLLLMLLLLLSLALAACTDKPSNNDRTPTLPAVDGSRQENGTGAVQPGQPETKQADAEGRTPAEQDPGQANPDTTEEEYESAFEVIENYTVEVDGSVGFAGN